MMFIVGLFASLVLVVLDTPALVLMQNHITPVIARFARSASTIQAVLCFIFLIPAIISASSNFVLFGLLILSLYTMTTMALYILMVVIDKRNQQQTT